MFFLYALLSVLILTTSVNALGRGEKLNESPLPATRELVNRAVILAESDRPWAAIAALKKSISVSPNYLQAHIEYGNVKADYLNRSDELQAEYRSLIRRFPRNPIYLMALHFHTKGEIGRETLQRVVELAPEWAWGHYAKAMLINGTDLEGAIVELQRCIKKDRNAYAAYETLIEWQEKRVRRIDCAIQTAKQLATETDIRPELRLQHQWRLRLVKQQQSKESKDALADELSQLERSGDVDILRAIRLAYLNLLHDRRRAQLIETRILALDPSWTAYRGSPHRMMTRNQSQVPRHVVLVNREILLREQAYEIAHATDISHDGRIIRLQELLRRQPSAALRRIIYEYIFQLAVRSTNAKEGRKYGLGLQAMDPDDSALLSQMALVLADKRSHLSEALSFARKAERLTAVFRPARRPPNTSQAWLDFLFPEEKQREQYERNRALALDALGWTLTQMQKPGLAERWLRQAIEIEPTESRLLHLATALKRLGRHDEAALFENESISFLADRLRKKFSNEVVDDLGVTPINGRSFKLSELKGKVVLINFWATWCAPCLQEMPFLKKLHEKYKQEGLQILAVSIDDDLHKVLSFTRENGLTFFVAHAPNLARQLKAHAIPASLFFDKHGHLRYRQSGFSEGDEREIEVVITELLKQ